MKRLFGFLLIFVSCICWAQDVTDVAISVQLARQPTTVLASITATQGDGTNCKILKFSGGSNINTSLSCATSDGKTTFKSGVLTSASAAATAMPLGLGDVLCLIGLNPTAVVVTMGSLGPIPSKGIAWQCTTNITGGGQTAPVSGTGVWP